MKRIVVCADDYGAHGAINAAVVALAAQGALSAASCMVAGPAWRDGARLLRAPGAAIDCGLHLDLLHPSAASRLGIGGHAALVVAALAHRLSPTALDAEIAAQLDAFEDAYGRAPDFVDGHRHAHQLPQVRERLLDAVARRYPIGQVAVRVTVPRSADGVKAAVIAALGGYGLRRLAQRRGMRCNRDFRGLYGFSARADYRGLVQDWLARIADGGLLVCHPGAGGGTPDDPIAAARTNEFRYLGSPSFGSDLAAAGASLVRFRDLAAPPGRDRS